MNSQLEVTEAEFNVTYNFDTSNMTITLMEKRVSNPDTMTCVIFSDDNLKAGLYNFLTSPNPSTCNDILQNYVVNPSEPLAANNVAVSYNVDLHTARNLYLLCSIGEFRTITNFDWSCSTVFKKIQMTAPYNDILFSNIIMPYAAIHVFNESFNRIEWRLVNSDGQKLNLKKYVELHNNFVSTT